MRNEKETRNLKLRKKLLKKPPLGRSENHARIRKVKKFQYLDLALNLQKNRVDENKDKEKKVNATDFKCETCEYKCKKKSTLLKHIQLKHCEQKCKICGKKFKESMELVSHVAEDHLGEEEVWNMQSTPKSEKENEKSSFVFSESIVNEFL